MRKLILLGILVLALVACSPQSNDPIVGSWISTSPSPLGFSFIAYSDGTWSLVDTITSATDDGWWYPQGPGYTLRDSASFAYTAYFIANDYNALEINFGANLFVGYSYLDFSYNGPSRKLK